SLLPLERKRLRRIAVIGPNADEQYNQLGDYTAPQPDDNITTILEGLRQAAPDVEIVYVKGCAIRDTAQSADRAHATSRHHMQPPAPHRPTPHTQATWTAERDLTGRH
uniref:glycoside hydrolase family 3 C-terminal domain-containing protein n=1 Tax=uncultured Duncaniella sp. TaxID=2768039 RepID=UPI0025A985AA